MSESIQERKDVNNVSVRVRLSHDNKTFFSLTFDDYDAACLWLEKNRKQFKENPQQYYDWKDDLYCHMRREKLAVWKHIKRPKLRNK